MMHKASTSYGSPLVGADAGGVSFSTHPMEFWCFPAWAAIPPDRVSTTDNNLW